MSHAEGSAEGPASSALFTDLYELSMAQAWVDDGIFDPADFEIFFRELGPGRGYLLANGIESVLTALAQFAFTPTEREYLAATGLFTDSFLAWLATASFDGDVDAVAEGTAIFPGEPVLRIRAPLPVAQILETRVLNAIHYESLVTTKAARIVDAAAGRGVLDFGARRAHGVDAAVAAARASWIAGCGGTSNMIAGQRYGLPVLGTMAHSYVQTHSDELNAFRAFTRHFPETTLLVDTWDTLAGVDNVIRLADELGDEFRVRAIRIDSGDLDDLARRARERLDASGLTGVSIVASGGLNEWRIDRLIAGGAPIDGFGVGTELVVAGDTPSLDCGYKLVAHAGRPCLKASPNKVSLPGPKQVFRRWRGATMAGDTIAWADEAGGGEPLLQPVFRAGHRTQPAERLDAKRERASAQRAALPRHLRQPVVSGEAYAVEISAALRRDADRLIAEHQPGKD